MYGLAQDFRFALRKLRKTPGFTLTVVVTLALGIGATTAIFSLVEGILLRPLPFSDPEHLFLLGDHLGRGANTPVTAREIGTYSKATEAFSSMGGYINANYELSGGVIPEQVHGTRLTAGIFPTLGVTPILGRVFTQQEEDDHRQLAVISYALWLNRYHRDPHILGGLMVLDRKPYSIIGVMPRSFEFPLQPGSVNQAQIWVPMSLTAGELSEDGYFGYHIVARLKEGVTVAQAAQDADRVSQQIMRDSPIMSTLHIRGDVTPLRETIIGTVRPLLRTLFGAVGIVLLIACANVAGLLLVRAIRRRRECAVRLALGASSSVMIRESLLEGMLLSMSGGLLGLWFAATAIGIAPHFLPQSMPRINSISMNATVAIFGLLIAVASGVICSLVPAFAALQTNVTQSLKDDAHTGSGASHAWLRSALIVSEIAIALILLTVSGAFLRSFEKMRAVDPGIRPDSVLVAGYRLPLNQYPTDAAVDSFNHEVIDRLSSKPGIVAVGMANTLPASGFTAQAGYTIEGIPVDKWKLQFAAFAIIYGDYFRVMGIPVLEGRAFTMDDRPNSLLVVIVNQTMARHYWPTGSAIGKRLHLGNPKNPQPWTTVVGVVADTKVGARDLPDDEQLYFPAQQTAAFGGSPDSGKLTSPAVGNITLRSTLPPEQMAHTLRSSIAEIDPLLALQQVRPMTDVISNVEAPRRFNTGLITVFAAGALLLAITGIYAVIAFSASQRSHEIAIRMALGAQRAGIARLVLLSAAKMALLGCVLGVLGSLAASRLVSSFLFEVSATDPLIYFAAVLIMMLMTLLASMLPAVRAASADPIDALRAT